MSKDEFFIHHFFTQEEADKTLMMLSLWFFVTGRVHKIRREGLNSGKEYYEIFLNYCNPSPYISRLMEARSVMQHYFFRQLWTKEKIDEERQTLEVVLDLLYQEFTGGNRENNNQ